MGLLFFPRGGSAHVARNLAAALPACGWEVTIVSGSLPPVGDAAEFYAGLDVVAVDMSGGLTPLHPSYEDRPNAPDRVFARLDDAEAERHAAAWTRVLQRTGAAGADILHLHHLTPLNEAAARVAPGVPIVGHLHGTELLMIEAIEAEPGRWPHGPAWAERMRRWAAANAHTIVAAQSQAERAERLLGIDRPAVVPNGYDPERFFPRDVDRAAVWRDVLGDGAPTDEPVLLYVGRFTEVKRVALAIQAYARARARFERRAPLVVVGGFPGECEGEHPRETVARLGVEDVHLAGWQHHAELPAILSACDAIVLPSVREQFGQALVEGMACGLPAIAVDAHGPSEIVQDGMTGWLVEPDDLAGLADALVEAINRPEERRRGAAARADVRERFSWPALAERVADVFDATSLREGPRSTR
jgi:glycosyltransferase involved in cell wall biosynthesis